MKLKILAILIIFCSIIGGALGSIAMLKYFPNILNLDLKTTDRVEIVRDNKTINITNLESEITQKIKEVSPSVVSVVIKKDITLYRNDPWGFFRTPVGSVNKKVGGGTGFFIDKNGTILTNKHVVGDTDSTYTVITNTGKEYEAKILAIDPLTDLAVIKIETEVETNPLKIVKDDEYINIGEFAIAIGNALAEFQNSVSLGIVSGKNRSIEAEGSLLAGLIQTDAAINPGNSGGPLINLDGEVIGINTAIVGNSNNLGFSIPLSEKKIDFIMKSIEKYGEIKRPFIGIYYVEINQSIKNEFGLLVDNGAYIYNKDGSIVEGSSADKSGLKGGDIIIEIDGIEINQTNSLAGIIQNKIPGDILKLKVLRNNGEIKNIDLELGEGK